MKGWVIIFLAIALYFVSIFGGFVQDDVKVIRGDPDLKKVSALLSVWTRPYYYMENEKSIYRPVTSFSFYLNALVTGREAWGFRLGNVLIYAWVCWLVFELMKKSGNGNWAFWSAMIFAVLPIHTEVVNNIVGRAEMLSLAFILLAMVKGMDRKWEVCVMYLFLAMLSKETAMVGVPMILYVIWVTKTTKDEKFEAGIFVMMTLVGFILLRSVVLGGVMNENNATIVENPLKFVTTEKRIMNAVGLMPFGVAKLIFPINLSYDYSYNQIKLVDSWFEWRVIFGLAMFLLSFICSLYMDLRKDKLWALGMALFWGPIFITGNIFFPIGTIFGERLWFWPSLGLILVITSWFEPRKKRHFACSSIPLSVIAMLLFIYAGRTFARNLDWLTQERLFLHDVQYVSDSVMAQNNAAAMYLVKHDFGKAVSVMEKANRIYPKFPELLNNWGMYYFWMGKKEEAKKMFEECLVERPRNGLCTGNLKLLK